jgi:HEAT repeat protein
MKKLQILALTLLAVFSLQSAEEGYYVPEPNLRKLNHLTSQLLYGEPEEAANAAEELMFLNSRRAVRALVQGLTGPNNFPGSPRNTALVKFHAARSLGFLGSPYAAKFIIDEYQKIQADIGEFKQSDVRPLAHFATGDSMTSPYFFLKNDYTFVLAAGEMLRALGRLEYVPEAETTLKDALKHKNSYIRASAADGLRLMDRVENLGPLKEVVDSETDDYAKASLLGAICTMERGATESFYKLTEMLKSDKSMARMKASYYLGQIELRLAEVPMQRALEIEDDPIVYGQMKADFKKIMSFKYPNWVEP